MRGERVADEEGGVKAPPVDKWKMPDSFKVADLEWIVEACGAPPLANTPNVQWIALEVSIMIDRVINPTVVQPEHKPFQKRLDNFKKAWAVVERDLPFLADSRRKQAITLRARGISYMMKIAEDKESEASRLEELIALLSQTKHLCFLLDRKKRGQHGSIALPYSGELASIFMRLRWAWEEAGSKPATASVRYKIIETILQKHYPGGKMATAEAIRKAIEKRFREQPELKTPEPYGLGTK